MTATAERSSQELARERRLDFWTRSKRFIQVVVVLNVILAVWVLSFDRSDGEAPLLPDVDTQFSLDLAVVEPFGHDVIYLVEQRARPAYRIFAFDPQTGEDTTVFTVPEDAIIYGIALSPNRHTLAVSYTPDFELDGSGIWTLDLADENFTMITEPESGVYLTELEWAADGSSVFATHVDRRNGDEDLALAQVHLDGSTAVVIDDGITPAVDGNTLYYLTVDEEKARRSIGVTDLHAGKLDASAHTVIAVADGRQDLDHLVANPGGSGDSGDASLSVAVLEPQDDSLVSIGSPASAHGNHNIRSAWWDLDDGSSATPTALEPIIVFDASRSSDGDLFYATLEGLSVADDGRLDLIKSRAIRFVAA